MTATTCPIPAGYFARLPELCLDQLDRMVNVCATRTLTATTSRARTLWMNRRELVAAEISRRGWYVVKVRRTDDHLSVVTADEYRSIVDDPKRYAA